MASKTLPVAIAKLAQDKKPKPSEGDLAHLKSRLAYGRDLEMEIEELVARAAVKTAWLTELRTRELPDLFEKLGMDSFGLVADGNLPAYDAELKSFYNANLPKDEEKREAALALLKKLKAEDLSKTKVEVQFSRGQQKLLKSALAGLRKLKIPFTAKTGVHQATLTAWVRERFESGAPLAPADLATIGATVGKVVKLEKRKDS